MESNVSKGLRVTFLVHVVVAAIFGIGFLILPNEVGSIYGLKFDPPIDDMNRLLGAAMLGWGVSSLLAWRAKEVGSVRIVVTAEIVWTALGALVMLFSLLLKGFPPLGWLNFAVLAGFTAAFALLYPRR